MTPESLVSLLFGPLSLSLSLRDYSNANRIREGLFAVSDQPCAVKVEKAYG